jgi:hypothetical protein
MSGTTGRGFKSKPRTNTVRPRASQTVMLQPERSWITWSHMAAFSSRT